MLRGVYLIIGVSVLFLFGVILTYVLSVTAGHTKVLWCFISYTGNYPVESCIFSVVLNACSGLYFLIIVIRYSQISEVIGISELSEKTSKTMERLNLASLVCGAIGSIGLSITGCFQQRTFHLVHIIGVAFCTCGTNMYFIFQTYFSFTLLSGMTKKFVKILRLLTVILSSIALFAGILVVMYHFFKYPGRQWILTAPVTVADTDLQKAGIAIEWIIFLLFQMFIYSFGWDFKRIALKRNQLIFLE